MQREFLLSLAVLAVGCSARPDVSHLSKNEYLPPNSDEPKLENNEATIFTGADLNDEAPATSLAAIPLQKTLHQYAQIESIQPSVHVASFSVQTTIPLPQTYSAQQQTYSQPQQSGQQQNSQSFANYNSPTSMQNFAPKTYSAPDPAAAPVSVQVAVSARENYSFTPPVPAQPVQVQQNYSFTPPTEAQQVSDPISAPAPLPVQAQQPIQDTYRYNPPAQAQERHENVPSPQPVPVPQPIQDNYGYTPPAQTPQRQEIVPNSLPVPTPQPIQDFYRYNPPVQAPQSQYRPLPSPIQQPIQDNYSYSPPVQSQQIQKSIPNAPTAPAPMPIQDNYSYSPPVQAQQSHHPVPNSHPVPAPQSIQDNYSYTPPVPNQEPVPNSLAAPSPQPIEDNYRYSPAVETPQRQYQSAPRPLPPPIQQSNQKSYRYTPPVQTQQRNEPAQFVPQLNFVALDLRPAQPAQQPTQNYFSTPAQVQPSYAKQNYLPPTPVQQDFGAPVPPQIYVEPQTTVAQQTSAPLVTAENSHANEQAPHQNYLPPAPAPQTQSQAQNFKFSQPASQTFLQPFSQTSTYSAPVDVYNHNTPTFAPQINQQTYSSARVTNTVSSYNYSPAVTAQPQPKAPAPISNYHQSSFHYNPPQTHTAPQQRVYIQQPIVQQPIPVKNQPNYAGPIANSYNYNPTAAVSRPVQPPQNIQFAPTIKQSFATQSAAPVDASSGDFKTQVAQKIPAPEIPAHNDGSYKYNAPTAPVLPKAVDSPPSYAPETGPSAVTVTGPATVANAHQQGTEYAQNSGYIYRRRL